MLRNVEAPTRPRLECRRETGLIPRCDRKVGNPFQTKQGSRPSCRDQEGRRGSEEVVPENLGVPLQGRQGSRGCIPDAPGETGIHLEWKQRTPLCSRIATGISWSSLGGLKGVKPPEAFGERPRDWSLGHAGDEGPHLAMTGESWGCSRAAAPVCGFSRGTTARSVSLSWGAREVGSPCEWRGRAPHCSRAMVGCRGPAPADPGYSKERRRRRRSGNHCLIKC